MAESLRAVRREGPCRQEAEPMQRANQPRQEVLRRGQIESWLHTRSSLQLRKMQVFLQALLRASSKLEHPSGGPCSMAWSPSQLRPSAPLEALWQRPGLGVKIDGAALAEARPSSRGLRRVVSLNS